MRVIDTYSSWTRDALTDDDWLAIRDAGPGEVKFHRFNGRFVATLDRDHSHAVATGRTPRKAFAAALEQLVEQAA